MPADKTPAPHGHRATAATSPFVHDYPFDPTYGYDRARLLAVEPPSAPADLPAFWHNKYKAALAVDPAPQIRRGAQTHPRWLIYDITYQSTDGFAIGGWLLLPRSGSVRRGLVVGHGYGGRDGPDTHLPLRNAALLFPCFRGLSRSARPLISDDPQWHVLHDIDQRDRYILGGCVADLWLGVSTLLALYPWLDGHVGYAGISFGGGIGALAVPWDPRLRRAHLALPTFGHHPLRLTLPSVGSVASVQRFHAAHPWVSEILAYYDAAATAAHIKVPMHVAAALFDPAVPPPGQFAIYNAVPGPAAGSGPASTANGKKLFIQSAGHFDYMGQHQEQLGLQKDLRSFFADL